MQMQGILSNLPDIASFSANPRTIRNVSSSWRESMSTNDRAILEGLWRKYPGLDIADLLYYAFSGILPLGKANIIKKELLLEYSGKLPSIGFLVDLISDRRDAQLLIPHLNQKDADFLRKKVGIDIPLIDTSLLNSPDVYNTIISLIRGGHFIALEDYVERNGGGTNVQDIIDDTLLNYCGQENMRQGSEYYGWSCKDVMEEMVGGILNGVSIPMIQILYNIGLFPSFTHKYLLYGQEIDVMRYLSEARGIGLCTSPIYTGKLDLHLITDVLRDSKYSGEKALALAVALEKGYNVVPDIFLNRDNILRVIAITYKVGFTPSEWNSHLKDVLKGKGIDVTVFSNIGSMPKDLWKKLLANAIVEDNEVLTELILSLHKDKVDYQMVQNIWKMVNDSGSKMGPIIRKHI